MHLKNMGRNPVRLYITVDFSGHLIVNFQEGSETVRPPTLEAERAARLNATVIPQHALCLCLFALLFF